MNINRVVLGGYLTKDIEIKHMESGLAIGKGVISVVKKIKDKEQEVSFIDFVCFGRWAEISADSSKKGDKVIIDGEIKQERWENDGQKRSKVVVVATQIYTHKWEKKAKEELVVTTKNPVNSTDIEIDQIPF